MVLRRRVVMVWGEEQPLLTSTHFSLFIAFVLVFTLFCLALRKGTEYAVVAVGTMASYIAFTIAVTSWRTQFRVKMNRLENEASTRAVESLINVEAVKLFGGEERECARYEDVMRSYQDAALKTQTSLSALNFGQNVGCFRWRHELHLKAHVSCDAKSCSEARLNEPRRQSSL